MVVKGWLPLTSLLPLTANSVQGVVLASRLMAPPCLVPQDLSRIQAVPSGATCTWPCRPPQPWEFIVPGPVAGTPLSQLVPRSRLRWQADPTRFCEQYSTYSPWFSGVVRALSEAGNGPDPMVS